MVPDLEPIAKRKDPRSEIRHYDPCATAEPGDYFDAREAQRVLDFFPRHLRHGDGEHAGRPFELLPWQRSVVANLFGWRRKNERGEIVRRYRKCFILIPRKNGKTELAAGISIFLLAADGEIGAEVYFIASAEKQSRLGFDAAVKMVKQSPSLLGRLKCWKNSITYEDRSGKIVNLASKAATEHGLRASGILIDEVHAMRDSELMDVLETSTAARAQPLTLFTTTSDYDRPDSVCNPLVEYTYEVACGRLQNSRYLPVLYAANRDDDWRDEEVWRRANPSLGIAVTIEHLRGECLEAVQKPWKQANFRRLHLNQRTGQETVWMPLDLWDACGGEVADPIEARGALEEQLFGRSCYLGLDLAARHDTCAAVLVFVDKNEEGQRLFTALPYFWLPEGWLRKPQNKRKRALVEQWASQGFLEITKGEATDWEIVQERIAELGGKYRFIEVAVDPWNAEATAQSLEARHVKVYRFSQGVKSFSAPVKEIAAAIAERRLCHANNPVLRYQFSVVQVKQDSNENIMFARKASSDKIDGMVAMAMAVGRAIVVVEKKSVYETRGLDVV